MLNLHSKRDKYGIPIASAGMLGRYATGIIDEFDRNILKQPTMVNIEELAELYFGAKISICSLTPDSSVLAITSFKGGVIDVFDTTKGWVPRIVDANEILIDISLIDDSTRGRYNFTIAHELGHLACHSKVDLVKLYGSDRDAHSNGQNLCFVCCTDSDIIVNDEEKTPADWVEWQADCMAAALLMPEPTFRQAVNSLMSNESIDIPYIIIDSDKYKNIVTDVIPAKLAKLFGVSKVAALIRMKRLGYVG